MWEIPSNQMPDEHQILNDQLQGATIEQAIVGWEGDDDQADIGSESNDGTTLIKVQLVRGSHPSSTPQEGVAKGPKVLARLSGYPFWCIPPKGMQCVVAVPSEHDTVPGSHVIIALPGANPFTQFSKDRAKLDVGPDMDLVLKARSITLTRHAGEGEATDDYISITPQDGITMCDHHGCGMNIKGGKINIFIAVDGTTKTVLSMDKDSASILAAQGTMLQLTGSDAVIMGTAFRALVGQILLGVAAIQPVLIGTTGLSAIPSIAVFA